VLGTQDVCSKLKQQPQMQICPGEVAGMHFGQFVSGSSLLQGARLPPVLNKKCFKEILVWLLQFI